VFGKGPNILNRLNQGLNDLGAAARGTVIIDCCPSSACFLSTGLRRERLLIPVASDFLRMRGALQIERTWRRSNGASTTVGRSYLLRV